MPHVRVGLSCKLRQHVLCARVLSAAGSVCSRLAMRRAFLATMACMCAASIALVLTQQGGTHAGLAARLLDPTTACDPDKMEHGQQCAYARLHPGCAPKSGLVNYIAIFYCLE